MNYNVTKLMERDWIARWEAHMPEPYKATYPWNVEQLQLHVAWLDARWRAFNDEMPSA